MQNILTSSSSSSSSDVTRSSWVFYCKYCIQDGNLTPRFSLLPAEESNLLFAFFFNFLGWFCHNSRCKFCALYSAWSVANIPWGVLCTRVDRDTCLWLTVDWAVRFLPISAKWKQASMSTNIEKHVPRVITSLLMPSLPISILHQLFQCSYLNSRDIEPCNVSFLFLPHRQSAPESLLAG